MTDPDPARSRLGPRFDEALQYASRLHAAQKRKGTEIPYVSHLLSVAALVIEDGGDEDQAIAALLHDAVEDQGGLRTREEIRTKFGERVAGIVDGCTDATTIPKPPWRERKERYIEHVRVASEEIVRVSAADKLHNARCILSDFRENGHAIWSRFRGGKEGTLWYYRQCIEALKRPGVSPGRMVLELERVVTQLEKLSSE